MREIGDLGGSDRGGKVTFKVGFDIIVVVQVVKMREASEQRSAMQQTGR